METASTLGSDRTDGALVRLGGLLGFLNFGIFVVVNFLLIGDLPPDGAGSAELKAYISDQADSMAIANGLRNLAFFCFAFFAAAVYTLIGRSKTPIGKAWGIVGLLGAVALMTLGTLANAFQTLIFVNIDGLSERAEIFQLLWNLSRLLFRTAQAVFAGIFFVGFSIAGCRSAVMPRWLAVLGLVAAAAALVTAVGIASVMAGGWAWNVRVVAEPLGAVWFLCVCVLLIRRAAA